jgi:hypothetical protein
MALIWARATSGLSNLPRPDAYHQAAEAADVKHTADAYRTAAAGDPACAPAAASTPDPGSFLTGSPPYFSSTRIAW